MTLFLNGSAPIQFSQIQKPYRPYHLAHHRFTETSQDPDLVLSSPFPITKASL